MHQKHPPKAAVAVWGLSRMPRGVSLQCHQAPRLGVRLPWLWGRAELTHLLLLGHTGRHVPATGSSGATWGQGTLLRRSAEVMWGTQRLLHATPAGDISWDLHWSRVSDQRETEAGMETWGHQRSPQGGGCPANLQPQQ